PSAGPAAPPQVAGALSEARAMAVALRRAPFDRRGRRRSAAPLADLLHDGADRAPRAHGPRLRARAVRTVARREPIEAGIVRAHREAPHRGEGLAGARAD